MVSSGNRASSRACTSARWAVRYGAPNCAAATAFNGSRKSKCPSSDATDTIFVGSDARGPSRPSRAAPPPLLDPERAQHFDRVRSELQSGADLAQLRRTLVDLNLEALFAQRAGGGETA